MDGGFRGKNTSISPVPVRRFIARGYITMSYGQKGLLNSAHLEWTHSWRKWVTLVVFFFGGI